MKVLLGLLLSFSFSALAKTPDVTNFILGSEYTIDFVPTFKFAKVEMTRSRFERMQKEDLILMCKITNDPDARIGFYKMQIVVEHKKANPVMKRCETAQCYNYKFEDIFRETTMARNGYDSKNQEGKNEFFGYGIESEASYLKWWERNKEQPKIEEMPTVTFYDPKVHGQNIPVTNGFYCWMQYPQGGIVTP